MNCHSNRKFSLFVTKKDVEHFIRIGLSAFNTHEQTYIGQKI